MPRLPATVDKTPGAPLGDQPSQRQRVNTDGAATAGAGRSSEDAEMRVPAKQGQRRRRARARAKPDEEKDYALEGPLPDRFKLLIAKSHLNLHQRMREVEGCVLDVGLGPSEETIFEIIRAEGVRYEAATRKAGKGHGLGPPAIHAYLAILEHLQEANVGKKSNDDATAFYQDDEAATPEILSDKVRVFRTAKCFDKTRAKIIVCVTEPARRQLVKEALVQCGVVWVSGRAPPGAMEDEFEKYLDNIGGKR